MDSYTESAGTRSIQIHADPIGPRQFLNNFLICYIMLSYLDLMFQDAPKFHDTGHWTVSCPTSCCAAVPPEFLSWCPTRDQDTVPQVQTIRRQPMEMENPLCVKGPPLNHASRACGSWPQPHLVRRTLRKDLSGTILFFLYFYFSISKQEEFETNDLVHLSQLYTSDFINVPCCHVPTLGTRMKHGGSWTLAEDGWWLKLLVKHFCIRHMFTISFHLCSPFLPFFKMFAPRSWRRRRK